MRLIQKEIGLEDITSRIPSLFPYIDFDIYGDTPIYNGVNAEEGLGILHLATDGIQGSYGHVMGSFIMPDNVELYDNAVMFYPSSYINSKNEIIPRREYNELSMYGRDCHEPCGYKNAEGDIIDKQKYDTKEGCDKFSYVPIEYINKVTNESIDAVTYRNKTKRSKYNFNVNECSDGERTIKLNDYFVNSTTIHGEKYKVLLFLSERNGGEITVPTSEIITSNLSHITIERDNNIYYRNSLFDKVENDVQYYYWGVGEDDPEAYNLRIYTQTLTPRPNQDVIYFVSPFPEDEGQLITNDERVTSYTPFKSSIHEIYAVSLKRQIIKPGETYSYRTMMNAYYAHYRDLLQSDYRNLSYYTPGSDEPYVDYRRFLNKKDKTDIISYIDYHLLEEEKQSFIKFVERGIGRYTIKECVEEYNAAEEHITTPTTYRLNNNLNILYNNFIDAGFYNIEDVYECTKYVRISNSGDNVYLYKNKIDGRLITSSAYENLDAVGSNSYMPKLYALTKNSSETLSSEEYDNLLFYGKSSYVAYQYIDSDFLTTEDYNILSDEDKSKYEPYTYVNINDNTDIITKSAYDSIKKNKSATSQYIVYRYVKIGYNIILAYEYDALLPVYKEDYNVFTYKNTTKVNDIITAEEYENLTDYGRVDYTAVMFGRNGDNTLIDADEYYNLADFGKEDYEVSGYYNISDIITFDEYVSLGKPKQYQPYSYEPKNKLKTINIQQYTALPKYGFKEYQPYQYYANLNVSPEGEEPMYQEFIITAEEYDNDSFTVGLKGEYSPYTYIPSEVETGDNIEDFIIDYGDYDNLSYFGQIDYNEIPGSTSENQINFEEDYENLFKDEEGNPIHEGLKNICPSLINGVIYLAQIDGVLHEMKKLKKSYVLLANSGIDTNDEIKCNYSKYLRMGGDSMVLLLEWLKQKADTVAFEMRSYADINNSVKMPLTLTLTLQDNGYYTPAMNYKTTGMIVYPGEPFTYVDVNGIADTYVYVGREDKYSLDIDKLDDPDYFKRLKDEVIQGLKRYNFKLDGKLESKLKTLKSRRTYLNQFGQMVTPSDDEDWLWYYVKGAIYDISMSVDEAGNLLPIDENREATGTNVLAYGSVLTDIVADNDTCTLTFTYYTDAHLKLVNTEETTEYRPYTEELYDYYIENYSGNILVNVCISDGAEENEHVLTKEEYENLGWVNIEDPNDIITQEEYNELPTQSDKDGYRSLKDDYQIKIKYREREFEIDLTSDNGKYHGVKYTDTYTYERYGELYELRKNENGFKEYISSTQRSFERYPFFSIANNVQTKAAGDTFVNVPYISSDFEVNFDYGETVNNELCNFVYKEDLLNSIHYKPIVENDAFILRGTSAAFERHLRLGEVKTLEDLENYHNGSFFNIRNNF